MTTPSDAPPREAHLSRLGALFFVSGATSLIWQTVWARSLHHVFGTSSFAVATVLAAFMAGLAAGGLLGARAEQVARPLRVYGLLEAGIGAYAAAFPWIIDQLTPAYLSFWRVAHPDPVTFGAAQAALVGLALLAPTTAMGATLPLLARFAQGDGGGVGDRIGRLYAWNTAGAVLGTLACGFALLPAWGLAATTAITAAANLALGGIALALDRGAPAPGAPAPRARSGRPPATLLAATALAGFAALVYEVAWTRVLVLILGASVYAFSVMLLAFLVGIAAGGSVGGRLGDRWLDRYGPAGPRVALALCFAGVGAFAWASPWAWGELPITYVLLFDALGGDRSPAAVHAVSLLLAAAVMTPPAALMGASFPLTVRAAVTDAAHLSAPVGWIYGVNTAGGALGAALAGFVLLPRLEVAGTLQLAAAAHVVAAALAVAGLRGGAARRAQIAVACTLALVAAVRPPWSPLRMTAGLYNYASTFDKDSRNRQDILTFVEGRYDLVHYAEGLSSVVTVARHKKSGNLWLANNGKVDASTTLDMPTQVLVGLLPFPWARAVDDVLVIGLASGITAGAVAQVDGIERLTVVELEPTMPAAARWFDRYNHAVLDDPRLDLVANDGRNHLLLTPEASYDVVVAEPSNPWLTGVSNLFTEEFFEFGKRRLKPGGVWAQWVQIYGMGDKDLRSLLATFAHVYPHVQLFAPLENADLVLVGSDAPLPLRVDQVAEARARWPRVAAELDGLGLPHPESLLASWVTDRDGVLRVAGDIERNTDDNMRIEYGAPLHLHRRTASRNLDLLARAWSVPVDAVDGDPLALLRLAEAYLTGQDLDRALLASAHAVDAVRGDAVVAEQIRPWLTTDAGDARALATLTLAGDAIAQQLGPDDAWSAAWGAWKVRLESWIRG